MPPITNETIKRLHREAPLTDLHLHPSLKPYLTPRNLWHDYGSPKTFNPFSQRSSFRRLRRGGVVVGGSALYVPERQLFKRQNCFWLWLLSFFLKPGHKTLTRGPYWDQLLKMMGEIERQIDRKPERTELALRFSDIARIRSAGKIAFVHTVEGAHCLEGPESEMESKVQYLVDRGVAMLTLTHFYQNGVVAQTSGTAPKSGIEKLCPFNFDLGATPPLTNRGRTLLRILRDKKVIVDLTHCTRIAREAVFTELGKDAPIVASHVGARALNPDDYNLTPAEIQWVADTRGAVGIIFMSEWLARQPKKDGIDHIWETAHHVRTITGSWDYVMLGSDFDGLTDPPDDLKDASELSHLTRRLLQEGLTEDEVKKVLGGNALRVLHDGWGGASVP